MLADDLSCGYATLTRIYLIPAEGGEYRALYTDLDIQIGHSCVSDMRAGAGTPPVFSPDGAHVYLQVSQLGRVEIARYASTAPNSKSSPAGTARSTSSP